MSDFSTAYIATFMGWHVLPSSVKQQLAFNTLCIDFTHQWSHDPHNFVSINQPLHHYSMDDSIHHVLISIFENGSHSFTLHRWNLMLVWQILGYPSLLIPLWPFGKCHLELEEAFLHCQPPGLSFGSYSFRCARVDALRSSYRYLCSVVGVCLWVVFPKPVLYTRCLWAFLHFYRMIFWRLQLPMCLAWCLGPPGLFLPICL